MQSIAQVIINLPVSTLNQAFSYQIPSHLDFIDIGWRVLVSFNDRKVEGFVVEIITGEASTLNPILDVLDDFPWYDHTMLQTAHWISEYYICTLAESLRLFIPGKSGIKTNSTYYALKDTIELDPIEPSHLEIVKYLHKSGGASRVNLEKKFGSGLMPVLRSLINKGLITLQSVTNIRIKHKYQTILQLTSQKVALEIYDSLQKRPAQQRLLKALLEYSSLNSKQLKELAIQPATVKKCIELGFATEHKIQVERNSYTSDPQIQPKVTLTTEQQQSFEVLSTALSTETYQSFLLHGITGSGKTQIYIEAVAQARESDRQAIILVPEISLTGQIIERFRARFGDDVVVMHSKLSLGERYDAWKKLHIGQAGIVIGARSAIFAPLHNIGLIILDEEHEFTYKQEEKPYYHTREVAVMRAELHQAVVLLGSATPSIETYFHAMTGKHQLLRLHNRIEVATLPTVSIVDMRTELKQGRRTIISQALRNLLIDTLEKKEQAIILLNRRGYATFVLCRECGHVITCDHCAVSMVYHASDNMLRCHYCHTKSITPDICPKCSSRYIKYFGTGTQKLEEELINLFPLAKIVRMDQDTTGGKLSHDRILRDFAENKYDILLGTQMVAKGHDIKNVTAVGIISADTTLNLPDFRSAERTFSLLTQASGRAGRGTKPGNVVIQTYNPEHYAIQASKTQDYCSFYNQEISFRQSLLYPPYQSLIKIICFGKTADKVAADTTAIAEKLKKAAAAINNTEVIGPYNTSMARLRDLFRAHILIKTAHPELVKKLFMQIGIAHKSNIIIDIDPLNGI